MNKNHVTTDGRTNDMARAHREKKIFGYFTLFFLLLIIAQIVLVIAQLVDWEYIYLIVLYFVGAKLTARNYSQKDLYISVVEKIRENEEAVD